MSTNEPDQLEFRGTDLKECETFIAAVHKHARAEGKLRDDQWIADLVNVCMAEEALPWWNSLDPETQGSWRLVKQAMFSRFRPLFYGKSGTEAEDFVHRIRQRALNMGMHKDPQWMADFASMCFAGGALRWYASLDPSVQGDWGALQKAIFTQYSKGFEEDTTAPTIPTPAPAAPLRVPTNHRHRGRIRVCRPNESTVYYLSKILSTNTSYPGRITVTSTIAEALEVEYELRSASDGLQALTIPNDQIKGCNQLGMKWHSADTTSSSNHLVLCGLDSSSGVGSPGSQFVGPLLTTPWKISSSGNEQGAKSVIGMNGLGQRLSTVSYSSSPNDVWFRQTKPSNEIDVELFFEPA